MPTYLHTSSNVGRSCCSCSWNADFLPPSVCLLKPCADSRLGSIIESLLKTNKQEQSHLYSSGLLDPSILNSFLAFLFDLDIVPQGMWVPSYSSHADRLQILIGSFCTFLTYSYAKWYMEKINPGYYQLNSTEINCQKILSFGIIRQFPDKSFFLPWPPG